MKGFKNLLFLEKQQTDDKENIKINVQIVYDKEIIKNVYNVEKIEDINKVILEKIKEINAQIPKYKKQ